MQVDDACISCGHCVAVCPTEAVAIPEYRMELVEELHPKDTPFDPAQMQRFLSGRRSIRQYQPRQVEREKLEVLLETGRMTPTASNRQNLSFVVLQEQLPLIRELAVEALYRNADQIVAETGIERYRDKFVQMHEELAHGCDKLFYGAPSVIVVMERGNSDVNGALAAARMEVMAGVMGLGVCYNGFFAQAAELEPLIKQKLGCREKVHIAVAFSIGYPNVTYRRTAPRKGLRVTWL